MTTELEEGQSPGTPADDAAVMPQIAAPRQKRDPIVTALVTTILLIVALTLVTVVYALMSGVFGTGAPRTYAEKRIMAGETKIRAGEKDPIVWMDYIIALVDDGQYGKAQEMIDKGKKTLKDQDISADMQYMQAHLYKAQGEDKKALETCDKAMKTIKDRYESGKANNKKTGVPDKASAWGLNANYYELLLLRAEIFEGRKDWAAARKAYDEYLAAKPTAATIFAKRGIAKEKLGDKKGAEADYRETLAFIKDNKDALAGLERIGAQ